MQEPKQQKLLKGDLKKLNLKINGQTLKIKNLKILKI